jgi:phosphosulfolactate synthase
VVGQIGPGFLSLPYRTPKPRSDGLTHVLDKGLSLFALESLIQTAGDAVDIVKLGWGTSYVSDGVKAKVALCRSAGIHLSPGGTLLEICEHQGRIPEYARWLQRLGVTHVEVSNGAFGMDTARKRELIRMLAPDFTVLSECGSKNPDVEVVAADWVAEMSGDLEAGASLLIAEARESGTVGLYLPDGKVRAELVQALIRELPVEKIIFEAPRKDQQAWFIRRLGSVANLGNIPSDEVVALETLRLGLRADTIDLLPEAGERPRFRDGDTAVPSPTPLFH